MYATAGMKPTALGKKNAKNACTEEVLPAAISWCLLKTFSLFLLLEPRAHTAVSEQGKYNNPTKASNRIMIGFVLNKLYQFGQSPGL